MRRVRRGRPCTSAARSRLPANQGLLERRNRAGAGDAPRTANGHDRDPVRRLGRPSDTGDVRRRVGSDSRHQQSARGPGGHFRGGRSVGLDQRCGTRRQERAAWLVNTAHCRCHGPTHFAGAQGSSERPAPFHAAQRKGRDQEPAGCGQATESLGQAQSKN